MESTNPPEILMNGTAADCLSPKTSLLADYWRERMAPDGTLPRWRDFELMDLYAIAPTLAVKDVIDAGGDFINRYWGSQLTNALGFEGTQARVSTYRPITMRETVLKRYRQLVATREPSLARGRISSMPGLEYLHFELIHMPLRGDGSSVDHIISVYDFGFRIGDPGAV